MVAAGTRLILSLRIRKIWPKVIPKVTPKNPKVVLRATQKVHQNRAVVVQLPAPAALNPNHMV